MTLPHSTQYVHPFDEWVQTFNNQPGVALDTVEGGVPVVYLTEQTESANLAIEHISVGEMNCKTCKLRLATLLTMRGANNEPIFLPGDKDQYPEFFHGLYDASREGDCKSVVMANPAMFGDKESGGFHHFSVKTSTPFVCVPRKTDKQAMLAKYVPILHNFFDTQCQPGIEESLVVLHEVLATVTYGDMLLPSVEWMEKFMIDEWEHLSKSQALLRLADAVLNVSFVRDYVSNDVSSPIIYQAMNNTCDVLSCCNDRANLARLLKDRLDPRKREVKTTAPKNQQIDNAIKIIGNFSVKLMTLGSAIKQGAIEIGGNHSSLHHFENMKKNKKNGAAGFASRSNQIGRFENMNIRQFMERIPEQLEVHVSYSDQVLRAVDFEDLNDGIYNWPYSWGYGPGSPSDYGLQGWCKVVAVMKLGSRNYIFICDNAKVGVDRSPLVHVSFLRPEVNKSCGGAFGALAVKQMMKIPQNERHFAIGIGASAVNSTDPNATMSKSIRLRSNNIEFTIQ